VNPAGALSLSLSLSLLGHRDPLVNAQTAAAVSLSLVYRIHVACGLGRGRRPAATRDHRAWHTHPGHLTFEPSWTLVCVRRVLTAPDGLRFGTADQTQRRAGGRESSHTAAPHTGFPFSLPCLIFRRIHVCTIEATCVAGARINGWPALGPAAPMPARVSRGGTWGAGGATRGRGRVNGRAGPGASA